MPKRRKHERYAGKYFTWTILTRDDVYWADGRSNSVNAGRHSLGTKDRAEALELLPRLDLTIAIENGLAQPEALAPLSGETLPLETGRKLYEDHITRSRITGGTRKGTQKRYRAVLDKFLPFLESKSVTGWNRVTSNLLEQYLTYLETHEYSYATQYLEGTTIKQIVNFFISKKRLPAESRIELKLPKPQGTDTYCWRTEEVLAILDFMKTKAELSWLHPLLMTLTYTGLRIGEAISLRWSDIRFANETIHLVDESTSSRRKTERELRTTKGGRDRSFPLNPELRPILVNMPQHADGYVFHGPLGGRLKADTVRNVLIREVLKPLSVRFPTPEGEVGFKDGRLHSFRHFFCSLCANKNVPQQMVMRWLGHRDSKLVAHYYHLHDEEAQRQMEKIQLQQTGIASQTTSE
jgi:integrase